MTNLYESKYLICISNTFLNILKENNFYKICFYILLLTFIYLRNIGICYTYTPSLYPLIELEKQKHRLKYLV